MTSDGTLASMRRTTCEWRKMCICISIRGGLTPGRRGSRSLAPVRPDGFHLGDTAASLMGWRVIRRYYPFSSSFRGGRGLVKISEARHLCVGAICTPTQKFSVGRAHIAGGQKGSQKADLLVLGPFRRPRKGFQAADLVVPLVKIHIVGGQNGFETPDLMG
jgi:hypothetical protein